MTVHRKTVIGDATLTASGIARLAGVGRAAVSNWRRRYADFPTPIGGTPASPHFNAQEVDEWLRRQGKLRQAGAGQWAWRHIETYQPAAQLGHVLGLAGAYLLARAEQPASGSILLTPRQLASRLHAIDRDLAEFVGAGLPQQWTPQMSTVLHAVDELAREQQPEAAFEYLHNQYVSSAQSMSGLAGTPDIVAEVMLTLAGTGARTFDFACGTGSILRLAAQRALAQETVTHCHAQEIKAEYALIALIRMWFVHRHAPRAGSPTAPAPVLRVGDSLLADAFPDLRADVVVANFPFGMHDWGHDQLVYDPRWTYGLPPRTEPELAWVQHALAHLSLGGTAVVLMPPSAAVRPAGRRIRAELVRRGALRAVVALPAGLMQPSGVGLHVWVLSEPRPDDEADARVLFVDASATDRLAELIGTAWHGFHSGGYTEMPAVHRAVPAIDLLDHRVDLTPQRHLASREQPGDASRTMARITEFSRLTATLARGVPEVRPAPAGALPAAPQASLADLVRSGSMSVQRITAPAPPLSADTAGSSMSPPVLAGDIVISMVGRELVARVVTVDETSTELIPGTHVVRVEPTRFDPWFVAGTLSLIGDSPTTGRASGSGARLVDLRRYAIPVVPLPAQQVYGRALRQLAEFQASLDEAAALGAVVAREIRAGLASGILIPPN